VRVPLSDETAAGEFDVPRRQQNLSTLGLSPLNSQRSEAKVQRPSFQAVPRSLWTRSVLLAAAAVTTVLCPSEVRAQHAPHGGEDLTADELRRAVEGYRSDLEDLRRRLGIPGLSAAVARDGEVVWADGLGWADREEKREATATTPYRIASITKTMTAAVVVGLAHEGELDLDAPVARVLPDGPAWAEDVTVRQVLSHTSESEPAGTGFTYSGRYDVLSRVAEEAGGAPFPRLLVERVLEPAGMDRSYPVSLDSTARARGIRDDLATGYLPSGEPAPDGMLRSRTVGGNGVVATAPDLARWGDALATGEVASGGVRDDLWSPSVTPAGDTLPYGLGWWVEETPAVRLVSHGGQWPNYSGLLLHVRDRDLTLAVLANHQAVSRPFYSIGTGTSLYSTFAASFLRHFALRDLWDGRPPELPRDASADSLASVVRGYREEGARLHLGAELFGRGLVAGATGETARSDSLLRATAECCPSALRASEDLGLLFHLGRSGDPVVREIGQEAGRRRLERMPDDAVTRFHLAVSYARSGAGDEATPLLRDLVERESEIPTWMWSWSTYLFAEQIAADRPAEARRLLESVLEEGQDEGGLFTQVRALLRELDGSGG